MVHILIFLERSYYWDLAHDRLMLRSDQSLVEGWVPEGNWDGQHVVATKAYFCVTCNVTMEPWANKCECCRWWWRIVRKQAWQGNIVVPMADECNKCFERIKQQKVDMHTLDTLGANEMETSPWEVATCLQFRNGPAHEMAGTATPCRWATLLSVPHEDSASHPEFARVYWYSYKSVVFQDLPAFLVNEGMRWWSYVDFVKVCRLCCLWASI